MSSIYLSIYLSVYLSIHLSIYLSIYISIYLSIYHLRVMRLTKSHATLYELWDSLWVSMTHNEWVYWLTMRVTMSCATHYDNMWLTRSLVQLTMSLMWLTMSLEQVTMSSETHQWVVRLTVRCVIHYELCDSLWWCATHYESSDSLRISLRILHDSLWVACNSL